MWEKWSLYREKVGRVEGKNLNFLRVCVAHESIRHKHVWEVICVAYGSIRHKESPCATKKLNLCLCVTFVSSLWRINMSMRHKESPFQFVSRLGKSYVTNKVDFVTLAPCATYPTWLAYSFLVVLNHISIYLYLYSSYLIFLLLISITKLIWEKVEKSLKNDTMFMNKLKH